MTYLLNLPQRNAVIRLDPWKKMPLLPPFCMGQLFLIRRTLELPTKFVGVTFKTQKVLAIGRVG